MYDLWSKITKFLYNFGTGKYNSTHCAETFLYCKNKLQLGRMSKKEEIKTQLTYILADLVFPTVSGRMPEPVKVVRFIPLDLVEAGNHVPGMKLAKA